MIPLLNLASVSFAEGRVDEAEVHARRALTLAEDAEDDLVRALAYRILGQTAHYRSETELARSHLAAAVTLFQDAGHPDQTTATRLILGRILLAQGDPRAAVRSLSPARAAFHDAADPQGELRCLALLADCYEALEQDAVALTFWERAVELIGTVEVPEQLRDQVFEGAWSLALRMGHPELIQRWIVPDRPGDQDAGAPEGPSASPTG